MSEHDDDDDRGLWRRHATGRTGSRGSCPDDGTLAAFLDGRISAGEREHLEAHLALCARCRAVTLDSAWIAQVPPVPVSGELLARLTRAVGQREPLRLPAWLAIAAALLLTCGTGFLLGARVMQDAALLQQAAGGELSLNPFPVVSAP